ncbi:MAG: efflux RND transporter periplasmic adaptor subunit [Pseudomonadota bacterium]
MKLTPSFWGGLGAGAFIGAAAMGFYTNLQQSGEEIAQANNRPERQGRQAGGRRGYAPVVSMIRAESAAVARTLDVIGEARAVKSVSLTSEVTGFVEAINVSPGARVKEGDLLVSINDDEQQVALARARADYPIAKANAERYRNLEGYEAASQLEADQAQNAYSETRARLRAAEVAVAQRKISAPFDGVAGITDIEVGDYLRAGDLVTTLDDTSHIILEFDVPQESASDVDIDQSISAALTSAPGQRYEGRITAIDSRIDSESRTLRVEAEIDNTDGRLLPGAVVSVRTVSEGAPAISLPGLAIQWDREGAYVWRRNEDGSAARASVVIIQRRDNLVLVTGDISEGEVIVSEGADRVRRGSPLPDIDSRPRGARGAIASGAE